MEKYISYLKENFLTPEQYILSKFEEHEVILLGEDHAVKNTLDLAISLIPQLYQSGVYTFGMEFGASEDQADLDRLITSEEYDETEARRLLFNYNVRWAYKEYADIYKAAWKLNKSLPKGERKFRILNLSYMYNWEGYSGMRTPTSLKKVFHKGNILAFRANLVEREILSKGEKLLVLTGTPHAYTKFKFPVVDSNADEFYSLQGGGFGNRLHEKFGSKIFNVLIHQPAIHINTLLPHATKGIKTIETVMERLDYQPVGFDLMNTVMGEIPDDGYNSIPYENFTLKEVSDGYIFTKPLRKQQGCTVDYEYLKGKNFEDVQNHWPDKDWTPIPENEKEYWKEIEGYVDLRERY
ncbi:ChaN family lipoprotein [Metabacillus sp. 113a]|uniref:ChaN family lipoprotein n=1 Tax=Metabacillus sp. 113a TaxID=3404706 RepID=UPI003CF4E2DF